MMNVLIGFVVASALAVWLLGWFAVPVVLLFCFFACFSPRKKSGAVLSFIEKLGTK